MKRLFRIVFYLLVGVEVSAAYAGPSEDFFRAVNVDNAQTVQALLSQGFDPNTTSEQGQIGLLLALRDGSPKVAAALLADPRTVIDAANANGETALMMAALRGQAAWVERLLNRGRRSTAAVGRPCITPHPGPAPTWWRCCWYAGPISTPRRPTAPRP